MFTSVCFSFYEPIQKLCFFLRVNRKGFYRRSDESTYNLVHVRFLHFTKEFQLVVAWTLMKRIEKLLGCIYFNFGQKNFVPYKSARNR